MRKEKVLKVLQFLLALFIAANVIILAMLFFGKKTEDNAEVAVAEPEAETEEIIEEVQEPEVITQNVFLTGDMLIHGTVWMDADNHDGTYDFSGMVENIGKLAEDCDVKCYNQETILGGTELGLHGYPTFNSPQEVGDAMVGLGFTFVSTATNHSLDQGVTGIRNSHDYWKSQEENGIHMAGTYMSAEEQAEIPVYDINGITYTFLSWTYGCNGLTAPEGMEYLVNVYPGREDELLEQVRKADELSDVVIVAMHWGTEYSMGVNDEQKRLAQQLAEAGADIIVGNHPHVIEPVEWIGENTICYYAMGNMLSAQIEEPNLVGMSGKVTVTKTIDGDHTEIKLSNARADLTWNYYDPGYVNFKVIPFKDIDDAHLPNHEEIYQKYLQVVTSLDDSITIGL